MKEIIPLDYSRQENWCRIPKIEKEFDTFYVYATEYIMGSLAEGAPEFASMDNREMIEGAKGEYMLHATAFAESTNVFMPYYRQCGMTIMKKAWLAAYPIGYSITKEYLKANPHLKFATGECDTGVIVSWNTEGPKNMELNAKTAVLLPGAISINPLNWKLDNTYAPASMNKGSLVLNEQTGQPETGDVGADAQVFPERGVVVTHAKAEEMLEDAKEVSASFFGPDGRHGEDYTLYYSNIRDNVAKRTEAFKKMEN